LRVASQHSVERGICPIAAPYLLQPLVVSNSDINLSISPLGSRDIVGHVAARHSI